MKSPKELKEELVSMVKRKLSVDQPAAQSNANPSPVNHTSDVFLLQRHPNDGPSSAASPQSKTFSLPTSIQSSTSSGALSTNQQEKIVIDLTLSPSATPPTMNLNASDTASDWQIAKDLQAKFDSTTASLASADNSASKKQKISSKEDCLDVEWSIFNTQEDYAQSLKDEQTYQEVRDLKDSTARYDLSSVQEFDDAALARLIQEQFDQEEREREREASSPRRSLESNDHSNHRLLHSYGQSVLSLRCVKCKKALIYDQGGIQRLAESWFTDKDVNSGLRCQKCSYPRMHTCAGCGKAYKSNTAYNIDGFDITVSYCCDRGRLFINWVILCSNVIPTTKTRSSRRCKSTSTAKQGRSSAVGTASGVGYGDSRGGRGKQVAAALNLIDKDPSDDSMTTKLAILAGLLPRYVGKTYFDLNPPEELIHMIRRSLLFSKVSELLRNDSIHDVTKRKQLYRGVISFMKALSDHFITAKLAFEDRIAYPETESLLAVSFGDAVSRRAKDQPMEKLQSLARTIQPLGLQAQTFLKQVQAMNDQAGTSSNHHGEIDATAVQLGREIWELSHYLEVNLRDSVPGPSNMTAENAENDLLDWHRAHCVDDVPDLETSTSYYFKNQGQPSATPAKGRMKHIIMELASLRTSLPPGIYIRHSTSRLDMIKAMIVGPKDTPYENGLFEFDILLPIEYPTVPPKFHFKTTGGGHAHFNPNLYPEGKVCLSLINTWSGEPWRPDHSTLLQVLVSIQSMIFCEYPWCNEPGREAQGTSTQSKTYNKTLRSLTIRYALLDWARNLQGLPTPLKTPESSSSNEQGIWSFLIEKHFRTHARQIIKTVSKWVDEGLGNKQSIWDGMDAHAAKMLDASLGVPAEIMAHLDSQASEYTNKYIPPPPGLLDHSGLMALSAAATQVQPVQGLQPQQYAVLNEYPVGAGASKPSTWSTIAKTMTKKTVSLPTPTAPSASPYQPTYQPHSHGYAHYLHPQPHGYDYHVQAHHCPPPTINSHQSMQYTMPQAPPGHNQELPTKGKYPYIPPPSYMQFPHNHNHNHNHNAWLPQQPATPGAQSPVNQQPPPGLLPFPLHTNAEHAFPPKASLITSKFATIRDARKNKIDQQTKNLLAILGGLIEDPSDVAKVMAIALSSEGPQ